MSRYEVSFVVPVVASKTLLVEAPNEDEAYNIAYEMIDGDYYKDPKVWDLEFDDAAQCDGILEIGAGTAPITRS